MVAPRRDDLELDHVIVFVPSIDESPLDLSGFTVEPGQRHTGQGTHNRRLVFERNYVEILWIEEPAEIRARGLDFEARCAGAPGACRVGVVLRGRVPDHARDRFSTYAVPDAPGLSLLLLAGPVAAPFVAVFETDDVDAMRPGRRADPQYLAHPSGARGIERVAITAPVLPALDDVAIPGVTFAAGAPRTELDLGGGVVARW